MNMLSDEFFRVAEALRSPLMGTELSSPLVYYLIRSGRFRRVVETGAGYSSLFIAKALADNLAEFETSIVQLRQKTGNLARYPEQSVPEEVGYQWAITPPELANPEFYERPYEPIFYSIDNISISDTTAGQVGEAVRALGLERIVRLLDVDFRGATAHISKEHLPVDLVVWDGGSEDSDPMELMDVFLDEYWPLLDEGGMAVLHEQNAPAFATAIERKTGARPVHDFELIQLWEPHKFMQNGVLLVRRVGARTPRVHGFDVPQVFRMARRFLAGT